MVVVRIAIRYRLQISSSDVTIDGLVSFTNSLASGSEAWNLSSPGCSDVPWGKAKAKRGVRKTNFLAGMILLRVVNIL